MTTRPQKIPNGRHMVTPRKKTAEKKKRLHSHLVMLFFLLSESTQIYRSENLARFVSGSQAKRSRSCLGAVLVFCYGCNTPETPFWSTLCILRSQPFFLNSSFNTISAETMGKLCQQCRKPHRLSWVEDPSKILKHHNQRASRWKLSQKTAWSTYGCYSHVRAHGKPVVGMVNCHTDLLGNGFSPSLFNCSL